VFGEWIGTVEPLQAWIARATWIPEFNTYDEFMQTIYESASARTGTAGIARRGYHGYASWPRGCGSTSLSLRRWILGSSKPSPNLAGTDV
jgi:hypothetical protein